MGPSIGKRLFFSLGGSLLVLWLAVVVSVAWAVEHETEEIFDSSLQETAQRLLGLVLPELDGARGKPPGGAVEVDEHQEYLVYQVFNRAGALLLRSHDAPRAAFDLPLVRGFHRQGDRHFYVEASSGGQYFIVVAERGGHRVDTFKSVLRLLLLPMLALLPLAGFAVYWSVRLVRQPIKSFDQEIASRDGNDLRPLEISHLPTELAGVGQSVNLLLERLRLAMEAERNFTANSAHELRTPLAAAMAQLNVLETDLLDPGPRLRVRQAREMLDRLYRMTVKLLQLARTESGLALSSEQVDLGMLVGMLVRDHPLRGGRQIDWVPPAVPVRVVGDVDALGIALQNLLENAARHATPDTPVEVRVTEAGEVVVRNDSEPIPAEQLARLGQRFVRASQEKNGTGLGLSIVQTIARQSGGRLHLDSPCYANGRGFAATLCLRCSPVKS